MCTITQHLLRLQQKSWFITALCNIFQEIWIIALPLKTHRLNLFCGEVKEMCSLSYSLSIKSDRHVGTFNSYITDTYGAYNKTFIWCFSFGAFCVHTLKANLDNYTHVELCEAKAIYCSVGRFTAAEPLNNTIYCRGPFSTLWVSPPLSKWTKDTSRPRGQWIKASAINLHPTWH